ncbi:hypothetical protein [Streptomyces sp. NPDC005244]|uniref:hypothetical protein n=1 Tax=Streptomyces sp. NPDC005244 TaxID=3364708 RepID=UPI0036B6402E
MPEFAREFLGCGGGIGVAAEHPVKELTPLRMARAGRSMDIGCHVLTTAALQTILRGYPSEAVDMAQGAYERARHQVAPRVLAFAKLIEARAHARLDDGKAAGAALAVSERLLEQADTAAGNGPAWIGYYTPARMAPDAVEITATWAALMPPCAGTTAPPRCRPASSLGLSAYG